MPKSTRGPKTVFHPPGSGNQGEVYVSSYQSVPILKDESDELILACGVPIRGLFGKEKKPCSKTLAKGDSASLCIKCPRCGEMHPTKHLMVEELIMGLADRPWSSRLTSWLQDLRSCLRNAYPIFDDLRELLDWEFSEKDNLPLDPLLLLKYDTGALNRTKHIESKSSIADMDKLLVPVLPKWPLDDVLRMAKKVGFIIEGQELLEQDQSWPLQEERFLALGIVWSNNILCFITSPCPRNLSDSPMGVTETIFVLSLLTHWLKKHSVFYGGLFPSPLVAGNLSGDGTLTYFDLWGSSIKVRQGRIGESLTVQDDCLKVKTEQKEGYCNDPILSQVPLSLVDAHPLERQLSTVLPDGLENKPVPARGGARSMG